MQKIMKDFKFKVENNEIKLSPTEWLEEVL